MFVIDDNGSSLSGQFQITGLPVVPAAGEVTIQPFPLPTDDGVFTILPFPLPMEDGVFTILPFPLPMEDGVFTILPAFDLDAVFSIEPFTFDFSAISSVTLGEIDLSAIEWNNLLPTEVTQLAGFGFQSFALVGDAITLTLLDGSIFSVTLGEISGVDVGVIDGGRLAIDPSGLSGALLDGFNAGWI